MSQVDFWIYQKRDCVAPFAVHVTKHYEMRNYTDSILMDFEVYSEQIQEKGNVVRVSGIHFESYRSYSEYLINLVSSVGIEIYFEDTQQIRKEMDNIVYMGFLKRIKER